MTATLPASDARAWLQKNFGVSHSAETFDAIADFAVLWNLFEDRYCGKNANKAQLKAVASAIATSELPPSMTQALVFWRARYNNGGKLNSSFDHLFNKTECKDYVGEVLLKKRTAPTDEAFAALYIVYRLRNNFYHGPKEFYSLQEQVPNFRMGVHVLIAVFEKLGHRAT